MLKQIFKKSFLETFFNELRLKNAEPSAALTLIQSVIGSFIINLRQKEGNKTRLLVSGDKKSLESQKLSRTERGHRING